MISNLQLISPRHTCVEGSTAACQYRRQVEQRERPTLSPLRNRGGPGEQGPSLSQTAYCFCNVGHGREHGVQHDSCEDRDSHLQQMRTADRQRRLLKTLSQTLSTSSGSRLKHQKTQHFLCNAYSIFTNGRRCIASVRQQC